MHYYTPWQFVGLTEDASWGKVSPTWGSPSDIDELNRLFDATQNFCRKNDLPAFVGEFNVVDRQHHLLLDSGGGGVMTFFPSSDREFFSNTDDMRIVFNVDAEGHMTELTVFEGEAPLRASRIRP